MPFLALLIIVVVSNGVRGYSTPEITKNLINVTVPEGKDASFTCSVKNLGGFRVAWIKSDSKAILAIHDHVISNNNKIVVTHNDKDTWTLKVRNVEKEDAGVYMCQVNSEPMVFKKGELTVVVAPKIIDNQSSSSVSLLEGGEAILKCRADGVPTPKIVWRRSGQIKKGFIGSSLQLRNVSRFDMGDYICIARNGIPPAKSKTVQLYVNFAPQIRTLNNVVGATRHSTLMVQCTVEAYPDAVTYWTDAEGNILVSSSNIRIVEKTINHFRKKIILEIRNMTRNSFRSYVCAAKNTMGETEEKITVYELRSVTLPSTKPYERTTTLQKQYTYTLRQTNEYSWTRVESNGGYKTNPIYMVRLFIALLLLITVE